VDDKPSRATAQHDDTRAGWVGLAIFAGGVEHLDAALEQAVAPAVAVVRATADVERWSFARYVDGRGPHIRLDVRTADPGAAEFAPSIRSLNASIERSSVD